MDYNHRHTNGKDTTDQTDHSYPYKNEVSLSISDDQPAVITPTPSPRSQKSDETHPPHSLDDVALTKSNGKENRIGLDNPGFEVEPTKTQRPLSSFGHNNGSTDVQLKSPNGKNGTTEIPLTGVLVTSSSPFFFIELLQWNFVL